MQNHALIVRTCVALAALGLAGADVGCADSNPTRPSLLSGAGTVANGATSATTVTKTVANGATSASTVTTDVPFKGSFKGVVTVTPLAPPFLSIVIEGTGHATLLGQFALTIPEQVNGATSTGSGSFEFTAANGDTLTATFTGYADPPDPAGVLSIVENATITGGTGRFAGATGSFTANHLFYTATGLTNGSFEGTISSPGADQP